MFINGSLHFAQLLSMVLASTILNCIRIHCVHFCWPLLCLNTFNLKPPFLSITFNYVSLHYVQLRSTVIASTTFNYVPQRPFYRTLIRTLVNLRVYHFYTVCNNYLNELEHHYPQPPPEYWFVLSFSCRVKIVYLEKD